MKLGIRIKVFLAVLSPLLILAFILGFYFINIRIEDAHLSLKERGQRHADYLGVAIEFNLVTGNNSELQQFFDQQLDAIELITAIILVDSNDQLLVSSGSEEEKNRLFTCIYSTIKCQLSEDRLFFNKLVYTSGVEVSDNPELNLGNQNYAGQILGRIVFFYDTEPLRKLQRKMIYDGLLITTAAAFFAGLLAFIFANGFIRPILNLSRVVNDIQTGNLSARATPSASGELRNLEVGVNEMAAILERNQENLQYKIEKSTEQLLNTLRELNIKNRDLETARNRAEEASKIKDLFLARMSHELRTPLASVIGYLKLMEDVEDVEKRKNYGRIVDQASLILLTTINDILDFIKFEDGSVRLEKIKFNLRECLQTTVAMQQQEAEKKGLELTCDLDKNLPDSVYGDPARIAQIVTNILSNAIKFTFNGSVKLQATINEIVDDTAEIAIRVVDTGIGIPKKMQTRLFKPFVQAEDSISRRFGGSGLGLSIVHRLATSMEGYVSLVSDTDEGVDITVFVKLPLSGQELTSKPVVMLDKSSMNVLVVEDNDLNRQLIKIQLEGVGTNVTDVDSGVKAIAAIKVQHFDLILMDVHMPNMDGIALAPQLHSLAPDTPVYALTANITGTEEQQLLESGVIGVLYKPLSESVLQKLLNREVVGPSGSNDVEELRSDSEKLILPAAMKAEKVIVELNKLLMLIKNSLTQEKWLTLLEAAHKLLGSAKLFTRGPLANLVTDLEAAAKQQDKNRVTAVIKKIEDEIASF